VARKLADNQFMVCASQQYLETHGLPHTPSDLMRHNCIINKNIPNSDTWLFRDGNSTENISVSGNFLANTGGALYRAMLSGLGIAVLPTWFVGEDIKQGKLKVVLEDYDVNLPAMTDSAIYALYPAGQYLPPKVRVFIDYLIENLKI
jgi:DNA-binding transcriptional LysR family regulator